MGVELGTGPCTGVGGSVRRGAGPRGLGEVLEGGLAHGGWGKC